jgi:hypothetical protein
MIDGGAGRGIRLGGSDTGISPTGYGKRGGRRSADSLDEDDTLVETPASPFEDFDEFNSDEEGTPGERRRDPLRKSW